MANKEPTNILEELKFVGGVFASINAIRAHMDRISQTLATAATEMEKLQAENMKLKTQFRKAKTTTSTKPIGIAKWTQNGGKF